MNVRTCNNLCYLNMDAHEKLCTTELLMGSLEYRKKLVSDEIQAAKDQIAHITDSRVIRYKSQRSQELVERSKLLHLKQVQASAIKPIDVTPQLPEPESEDLEQSDEEPTTKEGKLQQR